MEDGRPEDDIDTLRATAPDLGEAILGDLTLPALEYLADQWLTRIGRRGSSRSGTSARSCVPAARRVIDRENGEEETWKDKKRTTEEPIVVVRRFT